jgi:hypothetical protein
MTKAVIKEQDTTQMMWLLLKAWIVALVSFSMLFALIFVLEMDYSLPTATVTKVIVTFFMASLFMLFSSTLFSFPLMVVAGTAAFLFQDTSWRHPRIVTVVWPIVGFIIYRIALHSFGEITEVGLMEWIFGYAITREGIATLIALMLSTAYFCFTLRAKTLPETASDAP